MSSTWIRYEIASAWTTLTIEKFSLINTYIRPIYTIQTVEFNTTTKFCPTLAILTSIIELKDYLSLLTIIEYFYFVLYYYFVNNLFILAYTLHFLNVFIKVSLHNLGHTYRTPNFVFVVCVVNVLSNKVKWHYCFDLITDLDNHKQSICSDYLRKHNKCLNNLHRVDFTVAYSVLCHTVNNLVNLCRNTSLFLSSDIIIHHLNHKEDTKSNGVLISDSVFKSNTVL